MARAVPNIAISDHAAPQKPKRGTSNASHSSHLLREDYVRYRNGFKEAFAKGKASCLQVEEDQNQNGILRHQPSLQYQMKCCRCCLVSALSCSACFHCAKPRSLRNRNCFLQGSLWMKKRRSTWLFSGLSNKSSLLATICVTVCWKLVLKTVISDEFLFQIGWLWKSHFELGWLLQRTSLGSKTD